MHPPTYPSTPSPPPTSPFPSSSWRRQPSSPSLISIHHPSLYLRLIFTLLLLLLLLRLFLVLLPLFLPPPCVSSSARPRDEGNGGMRVRNNKKAFGWCKPQLVPTSFTQ